MQFFIILIYLMIINLLGFVLMGIDKKRAINREWRISENTLWIVALLGGTFGIIIGMREYRHKTKHISFKYGMPLLLISQLMLSIYYFSK